MNSTLYLSRWWDLIWARRRAVVLMTVTAAVVALVVSLVLPKWYRAEASLLPPSEEDSAFGLSTLLRGISVPGIKVATQATPADVFIAVLESRHVNEQVIERFDLLDVYGKKLPEDGLKELARHTQFKLNQSGTISILVEDRDPQRAADMANAYVEFLDRFNRDMRMTKGRRTRIFIEQRIAETHEQLEQAEEQLAEYQSAKKAVALSPEMSTSVETAARLYAQRAALLVRLGVVRNYSRGTTDEEVQLEQQLAQLDRQLQSIPGTGLELARQLRDVKMYEQLYALLVAQYEEARISEARDVPTVEVLDEAKRPNKKHRPRRSLLVVVGALLGVAIGAAYALTRPESGPPQEAD